MDEDRSNHIDGLPGDLFVSGESRIIPEIKRERRPAHRALPVALLIEGRKCLVVGGGIVAGRKAEALLEAGAEVVLVAPDISEQAARLSAYSKISIIRREYREGDLEQGWFMVITATSDQKLNRQILDACHKIGILCACPDRGWQHGDWISPATFRHDGLTISVSTGGASCRRSRLIRNNLARHARELGEAELLIAGTDHRLASLSRREQLYLSNYTVTTVAEELRQIAGIHEFMLLNTCNRIELVALATYSPALLRIVTGILGLRGSFYQYRGFEAFRHLALVSAGLRSQIPRETHIRGQVKQALALSQGHNWSAGVLHDWVGRILRISNLIRRNTSAILTSSDVGVHCEKLLSGILGPLKGRPILVVGSGTIGRDMVKRLLAHGAEVTCCYHRHLPEFNLPNSGKLKIRPAQALRDLLADQDAVICAVTGAKPVLTAEHLSWLPTDHPLIAVDLGMPRNISPEFASARKGVKLVNLDDIAKFNHCHNNRLQQALEIANHIIEQHKGDYERVVADI